MNAIERLERHYKLMDECHEWTLKAKAADEAGDSAECQRLFKLAERALERARKLEPELTPKWGNSETR
jgi:hypothetical protein